MYQDIKDEMRRRYQNSKLMQNYRDNKEKMNHPFQSIGNGIANVYKTINGINKARDLMSGNRYTPSFVGDNINSFAGQELNSMPQSITSAGMDNASSIMSSNPMSNVPSVDVGNSAVGNAINSEVMGGATQGAAQGAQGAMQTAGNAIGKVAPVVGTAFGAKSAFDNFKKGDNVNGALDIAKTGAMFIPGVGWAVSGAIQLGQMIKNMFDKKRQQAMAKSQEENAKAQQQAQQDFNNQQQGIDEQIQQNTQNMQEQMNKQSQDTMAQAQQPQDLKQDIYNQVFAPEGQTTGQAANVQPQGYMGNLPNLEQQPTSMPTNYAEENVPQLTPEEEAISEQNQLNPQQAQQAQQVDVKQSLIDKFKNGLNDFSAGYQDNTNTDFAHGDLMNQVTGGAAPIQQNGNTFNLGAEQNKKSIMARLGELAGTGQRVMAHPLTQAAIAGGISKAAGGDIDDIAKAAFQYGSQKAAADRYYQQVTGNTNRPFLNSYSATDVTNKRLEDAMAQKQQQWMYEQMMKKTQQDWENQYKADKDERDYNYKVNKDKQDMAFKNKEYEAKVNNRGGYGRREYPRSHVQEEKYAYQQGLNKSIGQFQKYADALAKAKEKEGWFTNSKDKAAIEQAQAQYNKAREFMINTYGGDFIKYAKEQGWE